MRGAGRAAAPHAGCVFVGDARPQRASRAAL